MKHKLFARQATFMKFNLLILIISLLGCVGWITNVVLLVGLDFKPSYKTEIIRGLGVVVPPLGAVIGYIDLADVPDDTQQ